MISVVINCDTRPQRDSFGGENLLGVCNEDFLTFGIENKIKAFDGFEKEIIVCIDEHLPIHDSVLKYIRNITDAVIIRKHTNEPSFNCYNYLRALFMASGDIICHIDQDTNIFVSGKEYIEELIKHLDNYSFVSYPSLFSPSPDTNSSYDYWWCSTRWFMCKREDLNFTEIKKCLIDNEYLYSKYPASVRNPWVEHVLGLHAKYNGKGVFYPHIQPSKGLIFSWGRYEQWTLRRLNELPYDEVKKWVEQHPIQYPVDCFC